MPNCLVLQRWVNDDWVDEMISSQAEFGTLISWFESSREYSDPHRVITRTEAVLYLLGPHPPPDSHTNPNTKRIEGL